MIDDAGKLINKLIKNSKFNIETHEDEKHIQR